MTTTHRCKRCAELSRRLTAALEENAALMRGYQRMRQEVAEAIRRPPLEVPVGEGVDALREAAGGAWDGVDAGEYLGGGRGDILAAERQAVLDEAPEESRCYPDDADRGSAE